MIYCLGISKARCRLPDAYDPETQTTQLFFLSCLCGSERKAVELGVTQYFLSCLCGSEHDGVYDIDIEYFLSCLCGSELCGGETIALYGFLSCLCGSELLYTFQARRL